MTTRRVPQEPVALLLAGLGLPAGTAPAAAPAAPDAPGAGPHHRDALDGHLAALDARVEAVLISAAEPLPLTAVAAALDRPVAVVRQAMDRIRADWAGETGARRRGFELREVATGWRVYVRAGFDDGVRELEDGERPGRLSQAALETLAVIAYRQPITRGQIAAVRAVSVDSVMRSLQSRGLVTEVGVSAETGAALWGTTDALLVALGIRSLDDLPPISPHLAGADQVTADAY